MDKDFYVAELFGVYGGLLTENQREIFKLHFDCDLSLGEIAEIRQTSRQSVNDALKKAREILINTEEKLGICTKLKELYLAADSAPEPCRSLADKIKNILEE